MNENKSLSVQSIEQLCRIRGLLVDLDGVVHLGAKPTDGLTEFLEFVTKWSIQVIYVTNNSTTTQEELRDRLSALSVETESNCILTSSDATVKYLAETLPKGASVYAVGEIGLMSGLSKAGFVLNDNEVDAVVVGLDRKINYEKIRRASSLILSGAKFIACNFDSGAPTREGIAPGAGAIVASIQAVTNVEPIVIGKPQPAIFLEGLKRLGISSQECASVGDRLDIDILCAHRAGLMGILVLSGLTDRKMLSKSEIQPDLVFENLGDMARAWESVLK